MTRERWFFAQGGERRGPLAIDLLLSALVQARDPRSVLVWRRGLADWTRAEDVPEVEQRLAPLLSRPSGRIARIQARMPRASGEPAVARDPRVRWLALALALAGVVVLVLAGRAFLRQAPVAGPPGSIGFEGPLPAARSPDAPAPPTTTAPATPLPLPTAVAAAAPAAVRSAATPSPPLPPRLADREVELPASELRKLRGVAAWSGETLRLTVYNGTGWRVTELSVRIGRFSGDDFVYEPRPLRLLPPGGAVDSGVADLLERVVPDRKKAGLNPLDTGGFEGPAGPQPESFRWEIVTARGYPPSPPTAAPRPVPE